MNAWILTALYTGTLAFLAGVIAALLGSPATDPLTGISELLLIPSFTWLVLRWLNNPTKGNS